MKPYLQSLLIGVCILAVGCCEGNPVPPAAANSRPKYASGMHEYADDNTVMGGNYVESSVLGWLKEEPLMGDLVAACVEDRQILRQEYAAMEAEFTRLKWERALREAGKPPTEVIDRLSPAESSLIRAGLAGLVPAEPPMDLRDPRDFEDEINAEALREMALPALASRHTERNGPCSNQSGVAGCLESWLEADPAIKPLIVAAVADNLVLSAEFCAIIYVHEQREASRADSESRKAMRAFAEKLRAGE